VGKKEFASENGSATGSLRKLKTRPLSGRDPKRENMEDINFEPAGKNDVFNKTRSDDEEA
jgi:hypothetical protein